MKETSPVQVEQVNNQILANPDDEMNQENDTEHHLVLAILILRVLTSV